VKIACLTTSYPRFEGDIAGTFAEELNLELTSRGHHIEVYAPESPLPSPRTRRGIRVHEIPYCRPRALERTFYGAGALDNIVHSPLATLGLFTFPPAMLAKVATQAARFDAFLAHWAVPSGLVASLVANGQPHVVVFHSGDVHVLTKSGPLAAMLVRRLLDSRARLVFVADSLRARLANALPPRVAHALRENSSVISMGVRTPPTHLPGRDELRAALGLSRFTIVTLGRLVPIKGLDVLVRALAGLDADLVVLGDGPERGALERLANDYNVRARFIGTCVGDEKWRWLSAADAFAMPSLEHEGRTEGLPVALLEAMTAGLPVVATRTGGIPEACEGAGCILVEPNDAHALRESVRSLQRDRALCTTYIRRSLDASARFRWSEIAPVFESLLRP
jgi:glycosyltransferase involved in cell wall biosynthesis